MKKRKNILKEFVLFTILPFFIPLLNEMDENLIDSRLKWGIIIVSAFIDFFFAYKALRDKENDEKNDYIQKSIRYAYSGAHEIIERKRDDLSHETEFSRINIKENMLPYDIHAHINDICKEFKKVIASITQINNEFISIAFIYRYCYEGCSESDRQWKWIGGREPISKCSINEFVEKKNTTYYHIINGNSYYIFGDKKEDLAKENQYHLSKRDEMYNNEGSIFSIKVAFGNNANAVVEGVVTVSTHGKRFTENISISDAADVLSKMIVDEIFPYYKKLIEAELGLLYIRHINR